MPFLFAQYAKNSPQTQTMQKSYFHILGQKWILLIICVDLEMFNVKNTTTEQPCPVWPFYNLIIHLLFFLGHLYPISGTTSSRSDDGSSPQISLQRPFVYFGQSYNQIYVCNNNFRKQRNTDILKILGFCHGGIHISFSDIEVLEVLLINILIYCL